LAGIAKPPLLLLALSLALSACGVVATLTRPEGDGGWSPARRELELGRLAATAGVDLHPEPGGMPRRQDVEDGPAPPARDDSDRGPSPPGERAEAEPIDVPAALARAATGNRRLAAAHQQLAIARQRVFEARGRFFPATTSTGRYTSYTDALETTVNLPAAAGLGTAMPSVEIRDRELATINATMALPLDLSGEIRHALAAAQAGFRGEAARLWATRLEQDLVVISSYFTLLEAEKLRQVTAQTIAFQRQQLANAQQRFERGRLTKNQLLVVQVRLRNAEQRLLQLGLAIDQARWALNAAMGSPVDAPTEVADVRLRPELPGTSAALRTAYAENPALRALIEEQQRLEASAHALARSRLPRLSTGGAVDESTSEVADPSLVGAGFVGFEWDLGTDTRREARISEARIAADQNRVRIELELRELEQAVRSTHRAAEERLAALDTAAVAVEQAEENLRIRQQQFDVGRATSEDVLDAEALLAFERAVVASALYQAQTRRAELQRLMGQPLEDLYADGR
jgi:outer membrane protein TolC